MQRSVLLALAVVVFTSAAVSFQAAAAAPAPATPPQLPRGILPLHYDVSVVAHAAELRFEGRVVVTIVVRAATRRITLNAVGLTFESVRLAGTPPDRARSRPSEPRSTFRQELRPSASRAASSPAPIA